MRILLLAALVLLAGCAAPGGDTGGAAEGFVKSQNTRDTMGAANNVQRGAR